MTLGNQSNIDENIGQIAGELAGLIGRQYFEALTYNLSQFLNADVVLVSEITEDAKQGRTVAVCNDGEIADDFEFGVGESPFTSLLDESLHTFPGNLQSTFPEDYLIADLSLDAFAGIPLLNDNGKIIGFFAVMYRHPVNDFSDTEVALYAFASRVAEELNRKRTLDKLKEYESYLFGIIDLIDDVVCVLDLSGKIRLLSPSAVRLFGWTHEEMHDQSFFEYLTEDTSQLGRQEIEKCISSGLSRLLLSLKVRDKNGGIHLIAWSAITTRINNEINGCLGIIHKVPQEI